MKKIKRVTNGLDPLSAIRWAVLAMLSLLVSIQSNVLSAQGPCEGITFSFEPYETCAYRAKYSSSTDCFIEIRYFLSSGTFASYNVNSAAGFTAEVVSPSEIWVRHLNGFLPINDQTPLLFTLPYGQNPTIGVAFLDDCAELGCEVIGGFSVEPCEDPLNASIGGVIYGECGSLPYSNQNTLSGWLVQLLDMDQNVLSEQTTGSDGSYRFYDLPYGHYIIKEVAHPGWTPNIPASGEYVIELAASQQADRNFGNCYTNGVISGTVYTTCDSVPFTDQPVLSGWTVYLANIDNIVLDSAVTDAAGTYTFSDWHPGLYYVRGWLPNGSWTANIPASGQSIVNLAPSGTVVTNFGFCPMCDCGAAYAAMEPVSSNGDTCNYILNLDSPNNYCMDHIDVSVSGGYFADVEALADGLEIEILDSTLFRISCCCPCPYIIREAIVAFGGSTLEILVKTFIPSDTGLITCQQVLTGACSLPNAGSCCPSGMTQGPNYLFFNDDFDLGYSTFISESTLVTAGSPIPSGGFTVGNSGDAALAHPQWSCLDHTTNGTAGLFAMYNDSYLASNHSLFRTGIYVPPGSWEFSVWVNNLTRPVYNLDDPIIELWADNTLLTTATIGETPDTWRRVCGTWENTSLRTINVEVRLGSVSQNGNDIALDDVSFVQCVPPPDPCQTNIIVTPLNNCGLVQVTANSAGAQPITYQWCDGSVSGTQTLQLPCGPTTFCVTATCADGTTSTFTIPYNVTDPIPPVAVCNPGVGVDLDANCEYQVTPAFVDGGSTDDCLIQSMSVSPAVLTGCGVSTVTLQVTDWCGNTGTCTMGIQTLEAVAPVITCPPPATVSGTIGPDGACEAIYQPVQPSATDNCGAVTLTHVGPDPLQAGINTIIWTAADDCGNTATCAVEVTVECDTCYCGSFSQIVAYSALGTSGVAFDCGDFNDLPCPSSGQSLVFSGKFDCIGTACVAGTPVNWTLTQPSGSMLTGTLTAAPYFSLYILPAMYAQVGVYTLEFVGNCDGMGCPPCVIQFGVNCPDPCPCDLSQFQQAVNQGFATSISSGSCKACFSPLAFNDCDVVEWSVNSGPVVGATIGEQTFCYDFIAAGAYDVTMTVTRYKTDGTICEVFTWHKLVTTTCQVKAPCDVSVFPNSGFSEGAVAGGINSEGAAAGWYGPCGEPVVNEGVLGSHDGWVIEITGNLDSADVLAPLEPVCLEKDAGLLSLRIDYGIKEQGIKSALHIELYQDEDFEMNSCDGAGCFELAVIDLSPLDSGWLDLEIPYDLNNWTTADTSCGGISARVAVYVTNDVGSEQGGDETRTHLKIDNICLSADCSVAFTACPTSTVILTDCDHSGDEPFFYPAVTGIQNGFCDGGINLVKYIGPTIGINAPNGTYYVAYQLQGLDAFQQVAFYRDCIFYVSIVPDPNPPVFVYCPPDITLQGAYNSGVCAALAAWTLPVAVDDSDCSGNSVSFQSNVSPGMVLLEGPTTVTYVATDPTGNPAAVPCTFTVTVDCMSGTIDAENRTNQIRILPNPNDGVFTVELSRPAAEKAVFRVIDPVGKVLIETPARMGATEQKVSAETLPAGMYFLQMVSENRLLAVQRFVKQ